jgi:hypothetical protein
VGQLEGKELEEVIDGEITRVGTLGKSNHRKALYEIQSSFKFPLLTGKTAITRITRIDINVESCYCFRESSRSWISRDVKNVDCPPTEPDRKYLCHQRQC